MCNHYRNDIDKLTSWRVWAGYDLRIPNEPIVEDVWPKRSGLIIHTVEGRPIADTMLWGVPTKVRGASGKMLDKRVTNVRNLSSPFWRSMLATPAQRCLVPFVEFAEPAPGKDPATGRPAEHWFTVERPIAAFAGIWRMTEHGRCYAFLTTEPNELVAPRHPKAMPVILHEADHDLWLRGGAEEACALVTAYPAGMMSVR